MIHFLNGPGTNRHELDPSGIYGMESFAQIGARRRDHARRLAFDPEFRRPITKAS